MTNLNCSAYTCHYNQNSLCSRGSIEVQGKEAKISDDTCCASFLETKEDAGSSYSDRPGEKEGCEKIQITCGAEDCTYNDCHNCTASAIDISGENSEHRPDTCCDTFYCQNPSGRL